MSKSAKIFAGISLVMIAVLTAYLFVFDQTFFAFKNLQMSVQGETWHHDLLLQKQKTWTVRLLPHQNKNLWRVPLSQLRAQLSSDPSVLSASVERVWPQTLKIQIELKPILFVFLDGHRVVLPVTEDGAVLEKISLAQSPDVPFLRNRSLIKNQKNLLEVIALYQKLPLTGVISKAEVAEVDWEPERGLLLEMSNGLQGQIVLGQKDVGLKAKRVANVLKYLESQNQKWRVIDASFAKKVLVRLRKHS